MKQQLKILGHPIRLWIPYAGKPSEYGKLPRVGDKLSNNHIGNLRFYGAGKFYHKKWININCLVKGAEEFGPTGYFVEPGYELKTHEMSEEKQT